MTRRAPLRRLRLAAIAAAFAVSAFGPASAAPLDDAIAAIERSDLNTAKSILEPMAQKGDAIAQYYLGDMIARFATDQYKAEGVAWLRKSAQAGVADAMNNLATILAEGKIAPPDQAKATELFMQAASLGFLPAYNNLGLRSYHGIGRPPDPADAAEWFRLAADQGFMNAQFNLGALYAGGEGVKFDIVEAYKWLTLAMTQGHRQAATDRAVIAKRMSPAEIQAGEKRAREWKPVKVKRPATG